MKSGIERIGHNVTLEVAQRSCLGKRVFFTRNEARDNAARFRKTPGGESRSTYKCALCHGFHVTSAPKANFPGIRGRQRK